MDPVITIVVITVVIALIFDVINGFHDAANSIATIVSTRVLSPRIAVLWAAFFNFVAMFVFPTKVADTISKIVKIRPEETAFVYVVLSGLLGAIIWDLITWWLGLPTSSSHALIGGFAGAGMAYEGWRVIRWNKIMATAGFIPLSPVMGLILGFAIMVIVLWIVRKQRPIAIDRAFRKLQLFSAALYSLGHGGNDAQKTMGIIMALLIAARMMDPSSQISFFNIHTVWIIISCHAAMAIGTAFGGWRIVKTMGMKITKLKPIGGFCAETAGAFTLFLATHFGIPVSTTHTIAGAIIGVGSISNLSAVKWGVAARIVWAWIVTIPCAAIMASISFYICRFLHSGF
jgi:inorganic phosphate transporter, PiT family